MLNENIRKNLESAIAHAKDGERVPIACPSSADRQALRAVIKDERIAKATSDEWTFTVGNGSVVLQLLPGAK